MLMNVSEFDKTLKFISTGIGIRPVGSNALNLTRDYIEKKLVGIGLTHFRQEFFYNDIALYNVIGEIFSKNYTDKWILFVAHYDSVPGSRGAMDNASGVALIIELARALKKLENEHNYNFRFIALAGEEVGCVGSKAYVEALSDKQIAGIYAVYNFDIFISRKDEPSSLVVNTLGGLLSNVYRVGIEEIPTKNSIAKAICSASEKLSNPIALWSPRHYGHSDHQSFHEKKIESANVTIRGAKALNARLPQGYHTDKDIYSSSAFDYELLSHAMQIVEESILTLDRA